MLCNSRKITTDFQSLYHHGGKEKQWNSCSVALFDFITKYWHLRLRQKVNMKCRNMELNIYFLNYFFKKYAHECETSSTGYATPSMWQLFWNWCENTTKLKDDSRTPEFNPGYRSQWSKAQTKIKHMKRNETVELIIFP